MRKTVLLVETEPGVRALLRIQLRLAGLAVIEAPDGRRGAAAFAAHTGTVAVIVSGELDPRMDGAELLDAVRAIDPSVPVVFFLGQSLPHDVVGRPGVEVFLKPHGMWALCEAVARLAAGADRPAAAAS
jgi:DNA-binding NtrC family response regulator